MAPSEMVRRTLSFTARQDVALQTEADRLGISVGELTRRIIDAWVDAKLRKDTQ
jgi:hypothetical protein